MSFETGPLRLYKYYKCAIEMTRGQKILRIHSRFEEGEDRIEVPISSHTCENGYNENKTQTTH